MGNCDDLASQSEAKNLLTRWTFSMLKWSRRWNNLSPLWPPKQMRKRNGPWFTEQEYAAGACKEYGYDRLWFNNSVWTWHCAVKILPRSGTVSGNLYTGSRLVNFRVSEVLQSDLRVMVYLAAAKGFQFTHCLFEGFIALPKSLSQCLWFCHRANSA